MSPTSRIGHIFSHDHRDDTRTFTRSSTTGRTRLTPRSCIARSLRWSPTRKSETSTRGSRRWKIVTSRSGRNCSVSTVIRRHHSDPTARARLLAWLGRRFGPGFLLPHLLARRGARGQEAISISISKRRPVHRAAAKRCCSRANRPSMPASSRASAARAQSRGIGRNPAVFYATSCTASTTVSPRTSASSPVSSVRRSPRSTRLSSSPASQD